jgi:FAD dependent oxidoreductase
MGPLQGISMIADVVVYAATSAGVCAAVAAADAGCEVVLVEPGHNLGGMTSGGLGYTDLGDSRVVGGAAARLRHDIAEHYGVAEGHFAGPEPHVAEGIYRRWLVEAGVTVVFGETVVGVDHQDAVIRSMTTTAGSVYEAVVFVDASYEGDLLDLAGVPWVAGREDVALHGESFAGRQEIKPGMHVMPLGISPFVGDLVGERGIAEGLELLAQIKPGPMRRVGSGDGGIMSYGYRVCLTKAADRVPFERRDGYDPDHWELGRRLFDHWERHGIDQPAGRLIGLEENLPGGKCDGNSLGPFSLSVLDGSAWEYPHAARERREEIRLHHLHHAQDFLFFLSSDPAVPAAVRSEMQKWGLPADEFADTGHLPHQMYVREARRMVGQRVLTQHDLEAGRRHHDSIAMGSYHLDIREVQRTWQTAYEHPNPRGTVVTEGYLSVAVPPYEIPYRAMTPQWTDCQNLLVPVCVSASHVAFSSIRMEVQYQMLGHVAGRAAALAARTERSVQSIDVESLRRQLADDGQVLSL